MTAVGRFENIHKEYPWYTLKIVSIGCPETSVTNYQSRLRDVPKLRCHETGLSVGVRTGYLTI